MLVLARREGEELVLTYPGITIRVVVTEIHGKQARIGIDAPAKVEVVRGEISTVSYIAPRHPSDYTSLGWC